MITVGNKRVIGASSLMVPHGEEISVTYYFDENDSVKCVFRFAGEAAEEDENKSAHVVVQGEGDQCSFLFKNFNSPTGHSTGRPMFFGASDAGEQMSLMATVYKYKSSHRIQFQVMVGGVGDSNE